MNKHQVSRFLFVISDLVAGVISWALFYIFRKNIENGAGTIELAIEDPRFIQGIIIIPIAWVISFAIIGSYRQTLYKTLLGSLQEVFFVISVGAVFLLLFVISDDIFNQSTSYDKPFFYLFLVHLISFLLLRVILLITIKTLLKRSFWSLRVSHIGRGKNINEQLNFKVVSSFDSISSLIDERISSPSDIITIDGVDKEELKDSLALLLGKYKGYAIYIHERLLPSLSYDFKGVPDLDNSYVKLFVDPLSSWQYAIKRLGDILVSIMALVVLSPLLIWLAIKVRFSSKGDIIYKQERIGKHGELFEIYKFRSMFTSAEKDGPMLTSHDDDRCTPLGAWMRRWRLDELPQFVNVLKGEMSIVGPRPEREYYAMQLIDRAPNYPLLWRAKPGITSWGQIKYGYASNVEQMLQRFRYDQLYMERIGPLLDLRIICYTIIVLLQGKGR